MSDKVQPYDWYTLIYINSFDINMINEHIIYFTLNPVRLALSHLVVSYQATIEILGK